jgi:hypothetical protein
LGEIKVAILRVVKGAHPYVVMDKHFIEDKRLSNKAKGIMSYVLSKPDNWQIRISDIVNNSKDGKEAVASGLNELEKTGYIHRKLKRSENGRFQEYETTVYEVPALNPHYLNRN